MARPENYVSKVETKYDMAIKKEEVMEFARSLKDGDDVFCKRLGLKMRIIKKRPYIAETEYGYLSWMDVYQFSRGYLPRHHSAATNTKYGDSYMYEPITNVKDALAYLNRKPSGARI